LFVLARRALDQSNGAMFLNRKLIVQLSTSRFRPQPKETNNSLSQPPKQLMVMPTYHHHLTNGGGSTLHQQQQQPNTLTQPYPNGIVLYFTCESPNFGRFLFKKLIMI